MKEQTVSIKGLVKWLIHNRIAIVCVTLAAVVISVCFYSVEFMRKKDKAVRKVTVSGKITVTSDADAESMSILNSYSAAAYNFLSDSAVQKNAANAADAEGIGYDTAIAVYRSCTFEHLYYGIILYTYTTAADNADIAQRALGYLTESAEDALSGISRNLGLKVIDSLTETSAVTEAASIPSYLSRHKTKIALFIIGAFAGVCTIYAFIYLLMTRVREVNDLVMRYDLPVIAVVPVKKRDKNREYRSLLIKLDALKNRRTHYIIGQSSALPERLWEAAEGMNIAILVKDPSCERSDAVKGAGLYRVAADFDVNGISDGFDMVIVYIVRTDDKSFVLSALYGVETCMFAERQYKSPFDDIEENISDIQCLNKKVAAMILEEV